MQRNLFTEMSDTNRKIYAGKVLLFNSESEDIIFYADTLDEVEDYIRDWSGRESIWSMEYRSRAS